MEPLSGVSRQAFIYLFAIVAVSYFAYLNTFSGEILSWDDLDFTLDNPDVREFRLKRFFTSFYRGNYVPLTMISFAIDYWVSGKDELMYHFSNITLHALNACLVFVLFSKVQGRVPVAFLIALLFAVHPMQTESVAWISERKNVLCGVFYLSALICYMNYLQRPSYRYYTFVFLFYVLALFSKGMAISLPLTLFALDLWAGRPLIRKTIIEKAPFFLTAFVFGIVAIKAQAFSGFLKSDYDYNFIQKTLFSGQAFGLYVLKLIVPVRQSALYVYPKSLEAGKALAGLVFFVSTLVWMVHSYMKKNYLLAGHLLFFIANLIFILQFIQLGAVLIAEHYVYIACLGLFFPLSKSLDALVKNKTAFFGIGGALILALAFTTHERNKTWQNGFTFWQDILDQHPGSYVALSSMGAEYMLKGNTQKALELIDASLKANPNYFRGYYNRGLLFARTNKYPEAIADFTKAAEMKNYYRAYTARATVYYTIKDYPHAIADGLLVYNAEPHNAQINLTLGNCYNELNQLDKALFFYDNAVSLKKNEADLYFKRAIVKGKMQHFEDCFSDLEVATSLEPGLSEAYYWKGVACVNLKKNPCADFKKALNLGYEGARNSLFNYCK